MKPTPFSNLKNEPVLGNTCSFEGTSPIEWEIPNSSQIVNSQFTGNDTYFLWMKGKYCLSIVSLNSFKVKDIPDFWIYVQKKRKLKGIFAIGNKDCSKIFGVASHLDKDFTLILWDKNEEEKVCEMPPAFAQHSKYIFLFLSYYLGLWRSHL